MNPLVVLTVNTMNLVEMLNVGRSGLLITGLRGHKGGRCLHPRVQGIGNPFGRKGIKGKGGITDGEPLMTTGPIQLDAAGINAKNRTIGVPASPTAEGVQLGGLAEALPEATGGKQTLTLRHLRIADEHDQALIRWQQNAVPPTIGLGFNPGPGITIASSATGTTLMNGETLVMDQPLRTECSGQQGAATGGINQPTGLNSPARMTG